MGAQLAVCGGGLHKKATESSSSPSSSSLLVSSSSAAASSSSSSYKCRKCLVTSPSRRSDHIRSQMMMRPSMVGSLRFKPLNSHRFHSGEFF